MKGRSLVPPRHCTCTMRRQRSLALALGLAVAIIAGMVTPVVAGATGVATDTWYVGSFGSYGAGDGQFTGPTGIAASPLDGSLYVADSGNNRIVHLTATGQFLGSWAAATPAGPTVDPANTTLENPMDVAVSPSGQVYVVDTGLATDVLPPAPLPQVLPHRRVIRYSATGAYLGEWASFTNPVGADVFNRPISLAITANGGVIVLDELAFVAPAVPGDMVYTFSAGGTYQSDFGGAGTGQAQFLAAQGLAVSPAGDIYVADAGNGRVQQINAAGGFMAQTLAGQFGAGGPRGIAWGTLATVYATDPANGRVVAYNQDLNLLTVFGSPGTGAGQFSTPTDAAVTQDNLVCVLDTGAGVARVQQFQQDREPPKSVAVVNARQVTITRTDNLSGVYSTGWSIDSGPYTTVPGQDATPPFGASGPFSPLVITMPKGVHTLNFYSIDNAGNLEQLRSVTVAGTATRPVAAAIGNVTVKRNRRANLRYRIIDPNALTSTVTIRFVNARNRVVKTATIKNVSPNTGSTFSFKCTLKRGTYKWKVTAVNSAGLTTRQASVKKLTVK